MLVAIFTAVTVLGFTFLVHQIRIQNDKAQRLWRTGEAAPAADARREKRWTTALLWRKELSVRLQGFVLGVIVMTTVNAQATVNTATVQIINGVIGALTTPFDIAQAVTPIAAATDASQLCYNHNPSTGAWTASGPVCPVVNASLITSAPALPCQTLSVAISTPSGAVLTDLKAKFKSLVQLNPGACGNVACPSAD